MTRGVWDYRGKAITVDADGRFWVDVDDMEHRQGRATLADAKKMADEMLAVEAKGRHTNLALPVIDEDGTVYTLRGLNRTSGKVLGGPDRYSFDLYYPTAAVQALLEEKRTVASRLSEINAKLKTVSVPDQIGHGRISAEEYDARIAELEKRYNAAMVGAEDIVNPAVITGPGPSDTYMGLGDPEDD